MSYLVGAFEYEIGLANSLTLGLHQVLASMYRPTAEKNKIMMISTEFPSDIFAVQSWLDIHKLSYEDSLVFVPESKEGAEHQTNLILEEIEKHGD